MYDLARSNLNQRFARRAEMDLDPKDTSQLLLHFANEGQTCWGRTKKEQKRARRRRSGFIAFVNVMIYLTGSADLSIATFTKETLL